MGSGDSPARRLGGWAALGALIALAPCGDADHTRSGPALEAGSDGGAPLPEVGAPPPDVASGPGGMGGAGGVGGAGGTAGAGELPDAATPVDGAEPEETARPPASTAVLTFRNDNYRTGAQLAERILDVAAVRGRGMRLAFLNRVVGIMNAQPLYVPGLSVAGKVRDVIFAATVENRLYAFDAAEAAPGAPGSSLKLWDVQLLDPENRAARPLPRGIYSTPVIDLASSTMYVVYSTRNTTVDRGRLTPEQTAALDVEYFVSAVDIRDGSVLRTKRLAASYRRDDGRDVIFEARNHWCRPGLLLSGGTLYVACGMRPHEVTTLFHGWVFRLRADTFEHQSTFCTSPHVDEPGHGAGIWQSGAGLAEDPEGNVYFITGNGPADFGRRNYGDALVKLSTAQGGLAVAGAFSPETPDGKLAAFDVDFGSGGALVLPGTPFVFGAGKTGIGYLLERSTMAKLQEHTVAVNQYDPTAPVDVDWEGGPHLHGTPAFWRGPRPDVAYLYTWGEQDYLRRHTLVLETGRFDAARAVSGKVLGLRRTMPGGIMSISADGTREGTGILWATLPSFPDPEINPGARLHAFDAETLELLWDTEIPSLPKWMPPTVADGRVIMATSSDLFLIYTLGP